MYSNCQESITATALARNLAAALDRVRIQQHGIAITKGNQVVAELTPPKKAGYPITQLHRLLTALPALKTDADNLVKDQAHIRAQAEVPSNPWD